MESVLTSRARHFTTNSTHLVSLFSVTFFLHELLFGFFDRSLQLHISEQKLTELEFPSKNFILI